MAGTQQWQCGSCQYTYDEAQGVEFDHIAPGTAWSEVPHEWTCPDCGASKEDFMALQAAA
ncbi:MAG: rubredoxin [Burkholderiales bacterium]|nr:rubredoxin [Burkholderiales bacterium]